MNVLSLFDGMSCGQIALNRVGIKYENYFASEIDKYAITVTQANFPNTIQLGDITKINAKDLPKIDLIIGGSPCQGFSFAGKQLNFEDERSKLFFEYVRLLNELKPKYFLLENVRMKQEFEDVISKYMNIQPIKINSNLVSAQNRNRLYWTNIYSESDGLFGDLVCKIPQPKDKGILLKDILESEVDEKYFLSEKMINYILEPNKSFRALEIKNPNSKAHCLTISQDKRADATNYLEIGTKQIKQINDWNLKSNNGTQPFQQDRIYDINGITPALNANKSDLIIAGDFRYDEGFRPRKNGKTGTLKARDRADESCGQIVKYNNPIALTEKRTLDAKKIRKEHRQTYGKDFSPRRGKELTARDDNKMNCLTKTYSEKEHTLIDSFCNYRRLTPIECERLQTVPDNYTNYVSDSQRYKMLGNGWTVDVIAHIFQYMEI
jgi:DNA (cytosine-5)-methyltransferase 3A